VVEHYARLQGLWYDENTKDPIFSDTLEIDLAAIEPCIAGPKRPQDRVALSEVKQFHQDHPKSPTQTVQNSDIVIAAITSCTNTSNPSVLIAAGLLAKKALALGLKRKPWVKASFAPGSKVVTHYLEKIGLQPYLDELGFSLVGYGCTTCIGNSGPLAESIAKEIQEKNLIVSAILSGNRNFEGRIHPLVKDNWLASPPLVVAFALAGTMNINIAEEPIGKNQLGKDIFLKDIWPTQIEIESTMDQIERMMFKRCYSNIFLGE